jgi:hypothetical protein
VVELSEVVDALYDDPAPLRLRHVVRRLLLDGVRRLLDAAAYDTFDQPESDNRSDHYEHHDYYVLKHRLTAFIS